MVDTTMYHDPSAHDRRVKCGPVMGRASMNSSDTSFLHCSIDISTGTVNISSHSQSHAMGHTSSQNGIAIARQQVPDVIEHSSTTCASVPCRLVDLEGRDTTLSCNLVCRCCACSSTHRA